MSKKTEFKEDFERIKKIFFLCKESYLVLRELYKTDDNSKYLIDLKYRQFLKEKSCVHHVHRHALRPHF